jgi:hypothetical protein
LHELKRLQVVVGESWFMVIVMGKVLAVIQAGLSCCQCKMSHIQGLVLSISALNL